MEPRMLEKINDLVALRVSREKCDDSIKATISEIMLEIETIVVKANIPGYLLVDLGNKLSR